MPHHLPDPTPQQRHHRGDHTACRPGWCLAARASQQADQLSATLDQLQQTRDAGGADFPAGYEPRCTVCEVSIEHIPAHPDGRPGGWRHTTDHGQEAHTAHPGGGDLS